MNIGTGELVRRNAAFAATGAFAGLTFPTSDTLQVLGCVDSRVDPSDVLGEGVVMRNIGGRITPATLREWALLGRLGQGQPPRSGRLVILHDTGCPVRFLGRTGRGRMGPRPDRAGMVGAHAPARLRPLRGPGR